MTRFIAMLVLAATIAAPRALAQTTGKGESYGIGFQQSIASGRRTATTVDAARRAAMKSMKHNARLILGIESWLPELITGGEWTAVLKIVNLGTERIKDAALFFIDDQGEPLRLRVSGDVDAPFVDVAMDYSLIPGATLSYNLESTDGATHFGHIFAPTDVCLETDCKLYAEIELKNSNATRPDFETVLPLDDGYASQSMLWDHRGGFTTVLYIVNVETTATPIDIQVFDDFGQPLARINNRTLPAGGAELITLHVERPETVGHYGHLVITSGNTDNWLLVTGIRINSTNSYTPIRAVVVDPF